MRAKVQHEKNIVENNWLQLLVKHFLSVLLTFAWQLAIGSQSLTGSSVALTGTITTNQNAIYNPPSVNGLGKTMVISFGGGRGGVTYPSAGDEIVITLGGTATNSAGSTVANGLSMLFNFVET